MEFALVLPVLAAMVLGGINAGIVLAQKASLNSAVRDGARYGSVNIYASSTDPHTCTKTVQRAQENVDTLGMQSSAVIFEVYRGPTWSAAKSAGVRCSNSVPSSDPPCKDSGTGDFLFVIARYSTRLFIPVPEKVIDTAMILESSGAYRCEY